MAEKISLSIIVVNYRTDDLTNAILHSFRSEAPADWELIIVNNDSTSRLESGSGDRIAVLTSKTNLGFGGAVNLAAKDANGEWLLMLNPDVTWDKAAIGSFLTAAKKESTRAGIFGPAIFFPSGMGQASSGNFPSIWSEFVTAFHLPRWLGARAVKPRKRGIQIVDWVGGAVLLIQKKTFQELNGFDRRYFLYFEDIDLCRRAWKTGKRVMRIDDVRFTHSAHAATGTDRALIGLLDHQSLHKYLDAHVPPFSRWVILAKWHFIAWLRWLIAIIRREDLERRRRFKARWADQQIQLPL